MHCRDSHKRLSRQSRVPAEEIYQQPKIYSYLRESVKGQDTSVNRLSCTLMSLLTCQDGTIFPITLGGASGGGISTTINAIKRFLGMEEGQLYAKQFVEIHGASVSDTKHNTGGKEGTELIKRLNRAKKSGNSVETGKPIRLPYLCLFVEHVDKAAPSFISAVLDPLFDKGKLTLSSGERYQVPTRTPTLVLFTSTCVSDEISNMTNTDDVMASDLICRALRKRWPESNTVNHFGTILPYYPLDEETLRPLLIKKFEEYVAKSHITSRFGTDAVHYTDEVKILLVDHVLARMNAVHGAQGSIGQLFSRLELLFSTGLGVIETLFKEDVCRLPKPILISTHSIDTHRFAESLDKQLDHLIGEFQQGGSIRKVVPTSKVIESIYENPENRQIMARCDTAQPGTVNAVTMAYGDRPLCSLVVNINYTNIQIINHRDQHEEVHYLKKKIHAYKNTLKDMIETIDRSSLSSSTKDAGSFNITLKKIADDKRQLIESSSGTSSGDESEEYVPRRHRKRTIHNTHLCTSHDSITSGPQPPLNFSNKRVRLSIEAEEIEHDYREDVERYLKRIAVSETWGVDEQDYLSNSVTTEDEDDQRMKGNETLFLLEDNEYDVRLCTHCQLYKPSISFMKKRKDKKGILRTTITPYCSGCRAGRK